MEEITLKGSRRGFLIPALINVAIMGYNGWNWSQGQIRGSTKMLTIVPAALLLFKGFLMLVPMYLRLSGGQFQVRLMFGMRLSTPAANVSALEITDGKAWMAFRSLNEVETSENLRRMLEQTYSRRKFHLEVPVAKDPEVSRRLQEALVREPS